MENDSKYDVLGVKTSSKVSEQPMSIDETYDRVINRLADLKKS
jgi:non-canonical (house-cleaning) NTP pyrophosphatase